MDKLQIFLTVEETNAILQILGNLPTSSGAWPLLLNIKAQGEAQMPNLAAGPMPEEAPDAE